MIGFVLAALVHQLAPESAVSSAPAGREPLDAVAAVVERRVVTTSEVKAEARLVLLERAGASVAAGELDSGLLQKVLDSIVLQELLALEARRTGIAVREVDIDKTVDGVREIFGDGAGEAGANDAARVFLARFGVDEELLRSRARRDLAARALLQKVFAEVKVTDDEAKALAASKPDLYGAGTDVVAARSALERERRDARFQALIESIRRATEVRVVWRP